MQAKLAEHEKLAYLSLDLAKICREVPLEIGLCDMESGKRNDSELLSLFTELEFGSFIKRLNLHAENSVAEAKEEAEPAKKKMALGLRTENLSEKEFDEVLDVLESYEGDVEVFVMRGGQKLRASVMVRDCAGLRNELAAYLEEDQIKFFER